VPSARLPCRIGENQIAADFANGLLGVSYPTAWHLHKRLRDVIPERGDRYRLCEPDDSGSARVVKSG
jgi:hypothetical protein